MPTPTGPVFPLANGTGGGQLGSGPSEPNFVQYPTPAFYATAVTLTPADLAGGLILYGAAGVGALTLPTVANLEAAYPNVPINGSFEFAVSTTNTGVPTVTTNTGWTLTPGLFAVPATNALRYRARKTAAGAWTLHQVG